MPKNTVHGGGSFEGQTVPLNPDAQRAVAEGRTPDAVKSAFIGTEVTEDRYRDAMQRHGTDEYTDEDKLVVSTYTAQRGDEERAAAEERDGEAPGSRGRNAKRGASSPGKTSSGSTETPETTNDSGARDRLSTAPTTGTRSSRTPTGTSGASSTDGSGAEKK